MLNICWRRPGGRGAHQLVLSGKVCGVKLWLCAPDGLTLRQRLANRLATDSDEVAAVLGDAVERAMSSPGTAATSSLSVARRLARR